MRQTKLDLASLVLRVAVGLVFLPHGYTKVFSAGGAGAFAADMPGYGIPAILGYVAAYSELVCGILLIVGLLTRVDALLLACVMFVAAAVVQGPDALHDTQPGAIRLFVLLRGIELPLTLLAANIALLLLGPGRYSLDAAAWQWLQKRKAAAEPAAAIQNR
ncbi:MAG: DoxX family protein [Acidobacteriota bacterium]